MLSEEGRGSGQKAEENEEALSAYFPLPTAYYPATFCNTFVQHFAVATSAQAGRPLPQYIVWSIRRAPNSNILRNKLLRIMDPCLN